MDSVINKLMELQYLCEEMDGCFSECLYSEQCKKYCGKRTPKQMLKLMNELIEEDFGI